MPSTSHISASIPAELGRLLTQVAAAEERSKSYYIKKGLEQILRDRLEDMEDYEDAAAALAAHESSGAPSVDFDLVFKDVR